MTTIVLSHQDWAKIRYRIDQDYGKVTSMISWRLKDALGFTVRHHQGIDTRIREHVRIREYVDDMRLDFVDEAAATFFRMKYL